MDTQTVTIFFDVNETLSDLSTVADAFEEVGAARSLAATWFATVLRDGFALAAAGGETPFGAIATNNARDLLSGAQLAGTLDDAVDSVMAAFGTVGLHPDVPEGLHALSRAGHRLLTLSNGPTDVAERLLREAGALDAIDQLLTVQGHSLWKPTLGSYADAVSRTGTQGPAYLVAVHPWDIHGAAAAGLSTVWINRGGGSYPAHFTRPTVTVASLNDLAGIDLALAAREA
ncbi:haloacid dehalogenase type II [Demequina aurantiaca]|uniref:haloacid dehalogenase type II n=1 Tax=Demequina aurantiaca TaxID=676200 RepID=UPI003D356F21